MDRTFSEGGLIEVSDVLPSFAPRDDAWPNCNNDLHISATENGLLNNESPRKESKFAVIPSQSRLAKFNPGGSLVSQSEEFPKVIHQRDEISISVPSSTNQSFRKHADMIASQKVDWELMNRTCKKWFKGTLNMVILLWVRCVAVSGAFLFLVMTGMLNGILREKSQRDAWFEVSNQILNALFTLMCLYQHPKRFNHLALLCRWSPKDVYWLRKIYCKNGTYKPHKRAHIMVVIVLLHLNCFAQYALCVLNLGYKRSERPAVGIGICLSTAIVAPTIAGIYSITSPLGRNMTLKLKRNLLDLYMKTQQRNG